MVTAKACWQLSEHHQFDGNVKDSVCYQDKLSSLREVSEKPAFSPNSDICESDEAVEKSKAFVNEMPALTSKRKS